MKKVKKPITPKVDRLADLRVKALGRWNEQMGRGEINRQNGFASYSLVKILMQRSLKV